MGGATGVGQPVPGLCPLVRSRPPSRPGNRQARSDPSAVGRGPKDSAAPVRDYPGHGAYSVVDRVQVPGRLRSQAGRYRSVLEPMVMESSKPQEQSPRAEADNLDRATSTRSLEAVARKEKRKSVRVHKPKRKKIFKHDLRQENRKCLQKGRFCMDAAPNSTF